MSETPEIKLNEFGDLSRRQRRELEAMGIDPDTAVIEYLNTQSIPIQRPAEEVAEVPVVPLDVPTTTAEIFPASMSKREIRNVLDRVEGVEETLAPVTPIPSAADLPVVNLDPFTALLAGAVADVDEQDAVVVTEVEPIVSAVAEPVVEAVVESVPEPVAEAVPEADVDEDELDDDIADDLDEAEDDEEYEVETYSGPTTISEATAAAALEEAIAAHNAARVDNGVELDQVDLPSASDFEDFSGPSTGSIPTISNALILPTLPEDTGTIIPVVATGEVIVTEQLTLPSSIAQVGAEYGTLDTSELDVIADEEEITPSQDLAPVRAASAVSSYNANNAVVTVPRRMSDRLPLVLSITAGGLAVAVVALFVTGYILGLF